MRFLSKSRGIGGEIKSTPEEFIVKEITKRGVILEPGHVYSPEELKEEVSGEGKFAVFVLQKRDWGTIQALQMVAKRGGRGVRSLGYAGMKDKTSTSTQLASIFGVAPEFLSKLEMKDIRINGAWKSANAVEMGDLLGNAFEITINGVSEGELVQEIAKELDGRIANYFDSQRFGMRGNNFRVGMHIINNELEEAAMEFLTAYQNENNETAREARKQLSEDRDFAKAMESFPRYLRNERAMLYRLSKDPHDFAKALRSIPRGIALMFIHAVEAVVFNASLETMVENNSFNEAKLRCGSNFYGFPDISALVAEGQENSFPASALIGYETKEEHISENERGILESLGLKKESFKISSMPELSMRGSYRPVLAPFKDMVYGLGNNSVKLRFSLPAGAYATILINEITKNSDLDLKKIAPELKTL